MTALDVPHATLLLPAPLRAHIEHTACAGYPHETCGVLIGRSAGAQVSVERLAAARNLVEDRPHDRYELDPRDFLAADRAAHAAGLEIVGFWHSHPDGPALPSPTDRAKAWPDYVYLIAAVSAAGAGELRGWRLAGGAFEELTLAAA